MPSRHCLYGWSCYPGRGKMASAREHHGPYRWKKYLPARYRCCASTQTSQWFLTVCVLHRNVTKSSSTGLLLAVLPMRHRPTEIHHHSEGFQRRRTIAITRADQVVVIVVVDKCDDTDKMNNLLFNATVYMKITKGERTMEAASFKEKAKNLLLH